ncbi:MAG: SUEL-type lectin domain-containing protein, partial [Myxococcota bacterium]|nr:SUEL-type lectin domain-containing protein [Myxococcota bacterium]
CLGKSSCTVSASNGVFGDPCSGTAKKLAVVYACSGGVVDNCPSDPNKTEPGQCGCGVPEGTCNQSGSITHVGTTQVWDSNGQDVAINRPTGSQAGDLLVLFLHRTDDDLPLRVSGWNHVAECYKRDNGYDCSTEEDCTSWHNSDFCGTFGSSGGEGHDLAQSIFYKTVGSSEPGSYRFNMNRDSDGHPGWIILTALRGASTSDPVRDWDNEGCDGVEDSLFPSVYGQNGDMVLLSQSFDDAIAQSKFGAPSGTSTFGYVSNSDEAGFLFGGKLTRTGETGAMKTQGDGASSCKDALVSLTIRPK